MLELTHPPTNKPAPFVPQIGVSGGQQAQRKRPRRFALPLSEIKDRHTLRTVLLDDVKLLVGGQIDLQTGEVTPRTYKDYFPPRQVIRAKSEPTDAAPPWMCIPPPDRPSISAGVADKSRKKLRNSIKPRVEEYLCFDDAREDFPILDNLLTGARHLDFGGNTRPIGRSFLFFLLQHLDVITPAGIRAIRGCSVRHSEKLAQCLRVIVAGFSAWESRCKGPEVPNAT